MRKWLWVMMCCLIVWCSGMKVEANSCAERYYSGLNETKRTIAPFAKEKLTNEEWQQLKEKMAAPLMANSWLRDGQSCWKGTDRKQEVQARSMLIRFEQLNEWMRQNDNWREVKAKHAIAVIHEPTTMMNKLNALAASSLSNRLQPLFDESERQIQYLTNLNNAQLSFNIIQMKNKALSLYRQVSNEAQNSQWQVIQTNVEQILLSANEIKRAVNEQGEVNGKLASIKGALANAKSLEGFVNEKRNQLTERMRQWNFQYNELQTEDVQYDKVKRPHAIQDLQRAYRSGNSGQIKEAEQKMRQLIQDHATLMNIMGSMEQVRRPLDEAPNQVEVLRTKFLQGDAKVEVMKFEVMTLQKEIADLKREDYVFIEASFVYLQLIATELLQVIS